ncbi:SDR family NAD(P)-dependent oxidoreductase [Palleronia sp. LCG004]|uniref:SDR family NAD(P)-dependent oxidoreductase n=1 Tax=Palleronia sp. LCG004 TaxID=3079304 RepID=UPI002943A161|nr:SDR family NAD(P)-dependent oxidoreductase [Palleronia sp. LCG004]WOI54935.1 SDR family NAD(P)-dependent oxidoreductase [Palleronia sp. LCG004]
MPHLLVTGGARRIGASVARHFAALGWAVTIHCNRSTDAAQALSDELGRDGHSCAVVQGDLADAGAIDRIFDAALAATGPVDLLLNNASTFSNDDLLDLDEAKFDDHLAVNLKAPVRLSARMADQAGGGDGLVVNMLDNKVFALNPDFFTYTISKSALLSATRLLAKRLGGRPRVCGIAPSITLVSGAQSEAEFQKTARINPLGRRVFPEDIARTLEYLWREKGLDGHIVTLDGGQSLMELGRDVAFLAQEDGVDGAL